MYCPKCASQNMDNARFCRGCGTDLALVSQALTGQLPQTPVDSGPSSGRRDRKNRHTKEPRIDKGIQSFVMGMALILVAFGARYYAPAGHIWWFWMFIPAFSMIGGGIAEMVRWKLHQDQLHANQLVQQQPVAMPPQTPIAGGLPPRSTSEIYTPPSITENTTRHLDAAAQRIKDQS
jgi:hypothetical protein